MQLTPEELLRTYKRAMLNVFTLPCCSTMAARASDGSKVHAAVTIGGISQLGRDFEVADG